MPVVLERETTAVPSKDREEKAIELSSWSEESHSKAKEGMAEFSAVVEQVTADGADVATEVGEAKAGDLRSPIDRVQNGQG